jgi:hypothetical protein
MKPIGALGGSTGATLAADAAGKLYVVKGGNSPDHIRSEAAANLIYRAAGVPVPTSRLDESEDHSPKQVSEYVKGKTLASVMGRARHEAIKEIQKGFAVDALLANWDVVGLDEDNILVPDHGPPVRVDNGGSLAFRAQGKPKQFGPIVVELDTLRESDQGRPVFGSLTDQQVSSQINDLASIGDRIIESTPHIHRDVMSQRLEYMKKWSQLRGGSEQ